MPGARIRRGVGGRDQAREGVFGVDVMFSHNRLTRAAEGADVVDHGGNQGTARHAADDDGRESDVERRAQAQAATGDARGGLPPRVVWQVSAE